MRKDSEYKREAGQDHQNGNARTPDRDHDDHHEGLEPKLSIEELKKRRTVFTGPDGREYQSDLPASWTNAKVAADATEKVCQECRNSPHFDTEGYGANRELGRRIQDAFTELKAGKGFVMAWQLYPDKDHPRWQIADGCGCGCGCHNFEDAPTPKSAKRKLAKKAKKPSRR